MNKARRKQLAEVATVIEKTKEVLEAILEDEQDYYDNIPENLYGSEKAEASGEAMDAMEEAIGELDLSLETINDIVNK